MNVEVRIPQQGFTTEEVTILKWLKAVGDNVKKNEPIYEMESEKVSMEVESPVSGKLDKIIIQEGNTAAIGEAVAIISTDGNRV